MAAAIAATTVQCIFFREYLSIFYGNEIIIGIILSLWLFSCGAGCIAGNRINDKFFQHACAAIVPLAIAGLFCIRAGKLILLPGETANPLQIILLCITSEVPFSFINGYVFAKIAINGHKNPYGTESIGAVAGSLTASVSILLYMRNSLVLLLSGIPLIVILSVRHRRTLLAASAAVVALILFDDSSIHWKYPFNFSQIIYGREGEIVRIDNGTDTSFLLNGIPYKSTTDKACAEQSVHIPMAQRECNSNVLVIFDKEYLPALSLYKGLKADCIETEKAIAGQGSIIAAPETFGSVHKYDIIISGTSTPHTTAEGRFFTVYYFRHIKSLLSDSGIYSFTLNFSPNYLSPSEKKLFGIIINSLKETFKYVSIFPGTGYTFMASDATLNNACTPKVPTLYLEQSIIPSVSNERLAVANAPVSIHLKNTKDCPAALTASLNIWLDMFRQSSIYATAAMLAIIILTVVLMKKNQETISMYTTGFTTGIYSIIIILLYQSIYGLVYSRISILLVSLSCGFAAGSFFPRTRHYDLLIGIYCAASIGVLSAMPYPPAILFYIFHAGIGILTAQQFTGSKKTTPADLYAADLFGGGLGMILCSTILVPVYGIYTVAAGLGIMKVFIWVTRVKHTA
jgi:spermidine synthase